MPKLYGIGHGLTPDPKNTSAGAPPPGTEAKSGTEKDPGRDALGRFLKGRRLGRPKGSLDKRPRVQRAKVAEVAYALTFGNEDYLDSLQIRLLWGDVPGKVETQLWDYVYGPPPKKAEVQNDERKPFIIAMRKPIDYDPLAEKLAERKAKAGEKPRVIDANAAEPRSLAAGVREEDLPGPGEGQGDGSGMETVEMP